MQSAVSNRKRSSPVWRWIFICSITAQIALSAINNLEYAFGYNVLSFGPRAAIINGIPCVTAAVLLAFTPWIFRRKGLLGSCLWIVLLFVLFVLSMPIM
jgi:hypothetical protein